VRTIFEVTARTLADANAFTVGRYPETVLRTIAKPKWLGLLAAVLVVGYGFILLGLWQMNVAREDAEQQAIREAAERPVVQLDQVMPPHAAFPVDGSNRRVTVTGHYEPIRQVFVAERRLQGKVGWWVVVPFVVDSTGARIPVVRGYVATLGARLPVSGETLTLKGSLAPSESPTPSKKVFGPNEIGSIDVPALLNEWGGEIYNGFLFALDESPSPGDIGPAGSATSAGMMERVPPPDLPSGVTLRNAAYALQWWIFALFALWMWWKMVRDDHRRSLIAPEPLASSEHPEQGVPA
jgi:cytochrome oxidase assembly protein ShyY1